MNSNFSDIGKLLLRVGVAGLMLFHGVWKLTHGVEGLKPLLAANGIPGFIAYGIYVAEIAAPVFMILGYWTRIAALLIVLDMVMAIGLVFSKTMFTIKEMGGGWTIELEVFYLIASVAVFFLGAGRFSISRGAGKWD